jgi:hypothetical protein
MNKRAAKTFSRFWSDGTEHEAFSVIPDLGRADRKRLLSFPRASREIDMDL